MSPDSFVCRASSNAENGWGAVAIGRLDPHRPSDPPGKVPWHRGYSGYDGRDPTADEIASWPTNVIGRIIGGGRGILNLCGRVPVGVIGLDVDQYGPKHGLDTIAEHEARLGPLPPTYIVTARPFESASGIRIFAVPEDWNCVGVLAGGHVELIQRHHRFLAAPGSLHYTGRRYKLYAPRSSGVRYTLAPLPPRAKLPPLPEAWLAELYRKPRLRGAIATTDEIAAFAQEYTFNDDPSALDTTVRAVRDATGEGQTRPAYHRALWIAARKARAGCYPWAAALAEIEAAARASYAERGKPFDEYEFGRSIEHAVTDAVDLTEDALKPWGGDAHDVDGWRVRYKPAYRAAYRPQWRGTR